MKRCVLCLAFSLLLLLSAYGCTLDSAAGSTAPPPPPPATTAPPPGDTPPFEGQNQPPPPTTGQDSRDSAAVDAPENPPSRPAAEPTVAPPLRGRRPSVRRRQIRRLYLHFRQLQFRCRAERSMYGDLLGRQMRICGQIPQQGQQHLLWGGVSTVLQRRGVLHLRMQWGRMLANLSKRITLRADLLGRQLCAQLRARRTVHPDLRWW